ncbi:geranylgeranyl pyrophosphate synthetase [Chytridiales sp. JEL 0842]|nr:geranylgeranyl pyrophosphate synthetase [Chytridiales sp. JEL 0842]
MVDQEQDKILLEPYQYLRQQKGKEIRTKLIASFDKWLQVEPTKLKIITDLVEMLHTASLLIDDIEDGSDLRRGIPVAHKIYGVASTINCANYVDYVPMVNMLGLHFQIRDDYLNLTSTLFTSNKGFAEDITEGKFSYLVIHCIRSDTSNRQLINILKQRTTDVDIKKYAISLMEKTKTFEATVKKLKELELEARNEIARLGGNNLLEAIIDYLAKDYTPQN